MFTMDFLNFFKKILQFVLLIIYLLIIEHVSILHRTKISPTQIPLTQWIVTNSYTFFHILYVMERGGRFDFALKMIVMSW